MIGRAHNGKIVCLRKKTQVNLDSVPKVIAITGMYWEYINSERSRGISACGLKTDQSIRKS